MSPASGTGIELDTAMETLLAARAERPAFLSPVWQRTWLAEFGDRFEPVFIECGEGEPLAVAPLMRDEGRLTFIGDPEICDFMDVLGAPEKADEAYAALWLRLCAEDWTELDLWGLMATSPTRDAIKRLAASAGFSVSEELEAVAPRLALPGDWDEYVESLGRKDRHELRRKMRRLLDGGAKVDLEVHSEQSEVVAAMDLFLELHTSSRQDKTDFMTSAMASFFRRMASAMSAAGFVRLFMLYLDNKAVASVFCFDAGSHLYLYNSGYDLSLSSLSVGLVSKALCLRWAIENGKQGLDFLRGNEPYKYDLGANDQEVYRIVVRRPA
jgi:CelD/BcsL family acetyltransferase involved in cellulose biosynthesis